MGSDKAMNRATLELTQKIQLHFPSLDTNIVAAWNSCKTETLTQRLYELFGKPPQVDTLPDLFGESTLTKQIVLSKDFSLDKNVQPKQEFKYAYVNPDYAKDEYFAKSTLTGPTTLTITPTIRATTNQELVNASGQSDALAIVNALHNMLVEDPSSLDQYKDTSIVIPVSSIKTDAVGNLFCLHLCWNGFGWRLCYGWLDCGGHAGGCVASVSQ